MSGHTLDRALGATAVSSPIARRLLPWALLLVAAAWLAVRMPVGAYDVLWAEDGRDFLGDALADGGLVVALGERERVVVVERGGRPGHEGQGEHRRRHKAARGHQ